jgi:predicted PolB exonuclease-like 3'-5' exonuclease
MIAPTMAPSASTRRNRTSVRRGGAQHTGERSEKELIAAFVEKIATLKPRLVTFNGASFDLPVLRYRAMLHRICAPGLAGRPYFKRYTDDATDLCDVLSSFDSRSKMKLNDLCRALNLPGKPDGIDGSQVEQLFAEGRPGKVADYCECDVVSTYGYGCCTNYSRGPFRLRNMNEGN